METNISPSQHTNEDTEQLIAQVITSQPSVEPIISVSNDTDATTSNETMLNETTTTISTSKPIFPELLRPPVEQPLHENIQKKIIDTPTHFETDYISMKWIPEKRRIDVVWKQFVNEEKVKEVLLKEVAMVRYTKVKCLFLDARKFKGTNPNIPRWANEVWSQMIHDAGLKHFSTIVTDKDIFAVFSLKYGMGEKLTTLINCAVFKTPEEAEVWLRQYTHPEKPHFTEEELETIKAHYKKIEQETEKTEKEKQHLIHQQHSEQMTETQTIKPTHGSNNSSVA